MRDSVWARQIIWLSTSNKFSVFLSREFRKEEKKQHVNRNAHTRQTRALQCALFEVMRTSQSEWMCSCVCVCLCVECALGDICIGIYQRNILMHMDTQLQTQTHSYRRTANSNSTSSTNTSGHQATQCKSITSQRRCLCAVCMSVCFSIAAVAMYVSFCTLLFWRKRHNVSL